MLQQSKKLSAILLKDHLINRSKDKLIIQNENDPTQEVLKAMPWQIKHTQKTIASLEKAASKISDFTELKTKATLLENNLNSIQPQTSSVKLPDRADNKLVSIKLDPTKSVSENIEDYLHQYDRDRRGLETIQQNIEKNKKLLQEQLMRQNNFDPKNVDQVNETYQQLINEGAIKLKVQHSSKKPEPAHPRRFYTTDHVLVEVGKSSEQNDQLTLHANKEFYWMHVSELAGSHVVIHSTTPTTNDLQEAADLTAYYSKGRNLNQVAVDVLKAGQLYKPKGAKSGLVEFTGQAQTIIAHPSAELAERLAEKVRK